MNTTRHFLLTALAVTLTFTLFAAPFAWAQTATTATLDIGSGGSTGQYTSQAIVNGNPAVAYWNVSDSRLMYARNSAANGSGSRQIVVLDSVGDVGKYTSLAVVNGTLAISYYVPSDGDLKWAVVTAIPRL